MEFKFPEEEELNLFLRDILEEEVDDKFYLKTERVTQLILNLKDKGLWNTNPSGKGMNGNVNLKNIANTISTNKGEGQKVVIPCLTPDRINKRQNGRRFKEDGDPMFTLNTQDRHGILQIGMVEQTCKKRTFETPKEINQYLKDNKGSYTIKEISEYLNIPKTQVEHYFRIDSSRAIPDVDTWFELKKLLGFDDSWNTEVATIHEKEMTFESTRRVYSQDGCSPTLSSTNADKIIQLDVSQIRREGKPRVYYRVSRCLNTAQGGGHTPLICDLMEFTIRKLTPTECFRLMGFLEDEINLEGISNSQRYKLAGNGWDINLVSKILKEMNLPDNIKTFEMFAGYGGLSFALKKIKKPFECVGYSEIDKYAIECYGNNHSISKPGVFIPIVNKGDCTKINPEELKDFDLLTGGFPCQSFSIAGKGRGELDPRGTLFWDIIRIAEVKKPKYMLLENVKGLTNKNHKDTFNKILSELDRIGYDVFYKVCNSMKHGIPQSRDRIFFVCFRKDLNCSPNLKNRNNTQQDNREDTGTSRNARPMKSSQKDTPAGAFNLNNTTEVQNGTKTM